MNIESSAAKVFKMSDEVWQRHANPWSIWTRYSGLPLLCIAVWSRVWINWMSLLPISAVVLWIWYNPRIFAKPRTTKHWASKAVLGERVLLKEKKDIPLHHRTALAYLKVISAIGFFMAVYGLIVLDPWFTTCGTLITILGKTWFLDRMVWLYQDFQNENDEYKSWLY